MRFSTETLKKANQNKYNYHLHFEYFSKFMFYSIKAHIFIQILSYLRNYVILAQNKCMHINVESDVLGFRIKFKI